LYRLRYGNLDLQVRAGDGSLAVENRVQSFYQGRLTGRLGLDLRGAEPEVSLTQKAKGIQPGPLIADLTGNASLTGTGDLSADLRSAGWSAEGLRRNLAGKLSVQVRDGTLEGFNLERLIRESEARVKGRKAPANLPTQTRFQDLRASADIRDGILHNRDLLIMADHLRITGAGEIDLGRERFDYRFEPVLLESPPGQGIDELVGIPVPVGLSGSFVHPHWSVDLVSALRAVAERELRGEGGGLFKRLEEGTGIKGLERGLRGLFGR
jgi:AsmA protein